MITLGIDYGTKNIGLAISDETGFVAGVLPILPNYAHNGDARAVTEICALCKRSRVEQILLGSPLQNPNSPMFHEIAKFGAALAEQSALPLKYWDESFSSKTVEASLRGKQRKQSDSLAAQMLLQEYLDFLQETRKL